MVSAVVCSCERTIRITAHFSRTKNKPSLNETYDIVGKISSILSVLTVAKQGNQTQISSIKMPTIDCTQTRSLAHSFALIAIKSTIFDG